jgi:hypothetical protein
VACAAPARDLGGPAAAGAPRLHGQVGWAVGADWPGPLPLEGGGVGARLLPVAAAIPTVDVSTPWGPGGNVFLSRLFIYLFIC